MRDVFGWLGSVFGGAIFGAILVGVGQFFLGAGWASERVLYGLAGGALFGGVAGWYSIVQDKKHARALAELCERLNFTFDPRPAAEVTTRLNLPGHWTIAYRMAKASDSLAIELLDVSYSEGSGENSRSVRKTVAILTGANVALPDFHLQPNLPNIVRKLMGSMGIVEGVTFSSDGPGAESVRVFGESYLLQPRDAASTAQSATEEARLAAAQELRRVFNLEVLGWFAGHPGWHVDCQNGRLWIDRGDGLWPIQEREELILKCLKIFELLVQPPNTPAAQIQVTVAPALNSKPSGNLLFSMFWRVALCFMAGGAVGMALLSFLWVVAAWNPPPLVIAPVFFAGPVIGLVLGIYWGYRALIKKAEQPSGIVSRES